MSVHWQWQQNPFVGTKPYQGLLVILLMFDSAALENVNNSIYDLESPREGAERWYVAGDPRLDPGETARHISNEPGSSPASATALSTSLTAARIRN